jgi:uncharacterized protein
MATTSVRRGDNEHLFFAHLHSPQTVANIEAGNPVVEINVVDPIVRKGYRSH